jgi:CheY-like chemotaxis protein
MPKVLLVEDDNNLREIFQMRLQAEGYTTVVAADGEEGLVTAMKEKPDLLIADVMMPKLSGFEMVESLRAAPETKNIKVIMMTALGQAEDQARGEKLGVVKYLVKSQVTLEDFARVVNEALGPGDPSAATTPSDEVSKNNQQESEHSMQNDSSAPTNPAPAPDAGVTPPADPAAGATSDQQSTAQESGVVQDQVNQFASTPAADTSAPEPPAATPPTEPATPPAPATDAPADPAAPAPGGDAAPPADPTSNAL